MAGEARAGARRRLIGLFLLAGAVALAWLGWGAGAGVLGYTPPVVGSAPTEPLQMGWPWRGAVHVHTVASGDATGTIGDVAAAARELDLDFVVISEHARAGRTEEPRRPRWIDGVLFVFGEEASLDEGHILAIGTAAHRFSLGPTARQGIRDIRTLGGYSFIAHPDGAGAPWTGTLGAVDGIEAPNLAAAFDRLRTGGTVNLLRAGLTVPLSADATLMQAMASPPPQLADWDAATALSAPAPRPMNIIGSVDAHGPLFLGVPTYRQALGAVTNTVWLAERPEDLQDAPRVAARRIEEALGGGRSAVVVGAAGLAPSFEFYARPGGLTAGRARGNAFGPGERVPTPTREWTFGASLHGDGAYRIELLRDGSPVASREAGELLYATDEHGTYRVRVFRTDGPRGAGLEGTTPWILTNPIYLWPRALVDRSRRFVVPPLPGPEESTSLLALPGWAAESDAMSMSAMAPEEGGLRWQFRVPREERRDLHAALAWRPDGIADWSGHRGLTLGLVTEREWRVALHLWTTGPDGESQTWEHVVAARPPDSSEGVIWDSFRRLGPGDEGVVSGRLTADDLARVSGVALLVTPTLIRPGTDSAMVVTSFGLFGGDADGPADGRP